MARRGENIFKRKDGRWEARYVKGYELSGKIRYGFCYGKTYREAKEKAEVCKAALRNCVPPPRTGARKRFAYYCGEWLLAERGRVKESTFVKYNGILTRHILPGLGGCLLQDIDAQRIERFKEALLAGGLAAKTARDILSVLRSILKYVSALFPGALTGVEIVYPREPKQEARVLTREEQRRLVACLRMRTDACKCGILIAMLTGLRIGELCALQWKDVSLQNRTIHVGATMQRLQNLDPTDARRTRIVIDAPKSVTSIRTIPLTDFAVELCRDFDPRDPAAYVLTGTRRFMEPRQLQKRLAKYAKECGLKGIHFHTIRHTFATRCVEVGVEIKSLSEILGHANTSITLDRYIHSSMELKRANMVKLELAVLE